MPLWLADHPLVLASRSDVRGKMLAAAGLWFEIRPADVDERAVEAEAGNPEPVAAAQLLARAKANAVSAGRSGHMVLGADQTLARGAERFSKPSGRSAAAEQLRRLRGQQPRTAFGDRAGARRRGAVRARRQRATDHARSFGDEFIATYLDAAGDAASASVGAYQLEGIGVHLFERVEGDYFTILGLPLLPLLAFLRQNGWVAG